MSTAAQAQVSPSQLQMWAEAYRRGMLKPYQVAAYEAAAVRGAVDDPYAAARADEKASLGGALHGASLTFTGSAPFISEGGAAMAAGAGAIDNMTRGRPADFGGQWNRARAIQQGYQDQYSGDHPMVAAGLKAIGLGAQVGAAMATGGASEAPSMVSAAEPGLIPAARQWAAARAAAVGGDAAAATQARAAQQAVLTAGKRLVAAPLRNAMIGGGVASVNAAARPGTLRQRAQAADNAFLPGAAVGAAVPAGFAAAARLEGAIRNGATRMLPAAMTTEAIQPGSNYLAPASDRVPGASNAQARPEDQLSFDPSNANTNLSMFRPSASAGPFTIQAANDNNIIQPAVYLDKAGIPLSAGQRQGIPDELVPEEAADRAKAQVALNRELARRALSVTGETIPPHVVMGSKTADYIGQRLDSFETGLRAFAPIRYDQQHKAAVEAFLDAAHDKFHYQKLDDEIEDPEEDPDTVTGYRAKNVTFLPNKDKYVPLLNPNMKDAFFRDLANRTLFAARGKDKIGKLDNILGMVDHYLSKNETMSWNEENSLNPELYALRNIHLETAARQNPQFGATQKAVDTARANLDLYRYASLWATRRRAGFTAANLADAYAEKLADPRSMVAQAGGPDMFNLVRHASAAMSPTPDSTVVPAAASPDANVFTFTPNTSPPQDPAQPNAFGVAGPANDNRALPSYSPVGSGQPPPSIALIRNGLSAAQGQAGPATSQ